MAKKIYIVEDEPGILEAMDILLTDEGYEVATSLDARHAFAKIKEFQPNLVLLDMLMSGTDGRDMCAQIKRDKDTKMIPVVMVSAHPAAQDSVFKFGADDFLPKPFGVGDLLKVAAKYTAD